MDVIPVTRFMNPRNAVFFLLAAYYQTTANSLPIYTATPSQNLAFHIRGQVSVLCEEGRVDSCLHSHDLWVRFVGVKRCKPISLVRSGGMAEERMERDFNLPTLKYAPCRTHTSEDVVIGNALIPLPARAVNKTLLEFKDRWVYCVTLPI